MFQSTSVTGQQWRSEEVMLLPDGIIPQRQDQSEFPMKTTTKNLFALFFLFLFSVLSRAGAPAPGEKTPPEIVRAGFGLFDVGDPKKPLFMETSVVPRKEGQRYGWLIEVRTKKRSLSVREEYLLPPLATPPAKNEDGMKVILDIPLEQRVQAAYRQLVPIDNHIIGEWTVKADEPAGRRRLQVIIEEHLAAEFDFVIE
ncbi:MAG: hypothetical protein LBD67_07770 [Candidatus Accumulibacter sp.]|jgi:hypothetical protein|nr:hypothetical protein [Accumulibacter sp.]